MSTAVVTVAPGATLHDAAQSMAERNVGAAVVIDPEQPGPGIITERDVLQSVGRGEDPNAELVRDHLSAKLTFASPVTDAIAVNGFSDLPVRAVEAEFAGGLEWDHSDPFDRLLVAQAIMAPFILVTSDNMIREFKAVPQLWARA